MLAKMVRQAKMKLGMATGDVDGTSGSSRAASLFYNVLLSSHSRCTCSVSLVPRWVAKFHVVARLRFENMRCRNRETEKSDLLVPNNSKHVSLPGSIVSHGPAASS
jgi:hypothetical protein